MDHYIAYHSVELMGHEYEPTERFHFFSRKAESVLRRALGNRVWVVVGKRDGSATTFSLAGVFTPSEVRAESDGFGVVGPGTPFRLSIDVTTRPWFRALLREQQNFSFGFKRKDSSCIALAPDSGQIQEIVGALYDKHVNANVKQGTLILPNATTLPQGIP
jgi:hypothetical protein